MGRAKFSDNFGGAAKERKHSRETAESGLEQVDLLRQLVYEQQQTNYLLQQLVAQRLQ